MSILYERIADLCVKQGVTGYRLCKDTGISPSLITDLKMDRRDGLSAKTAQKIADYFDVSVSYLLGSEDEKKPADPKVSGLTPEQLEVIRLFDSADPVRRQIALDILRAAEAADKAGGTP